MHIVDYWKHRVVVLLTHINRVYSLPNDKVFGWSKSKGFADNKIKEPENLKLVL